MSEAKHTPEPWLVAENGFEIWTDRERPVRIATVQCWPHTDNAPLISAAPDLLRELTTFHDYAIQLGIHHCGQDGQPCPVQAAINKATGVTS